MKLYSVCALFLSIFLVPSFFVQSEEIDLVIHGQEVFHSLGCAECHSEIKNDVSVKTGPGLYGLLQKEARDRDVIAGGEKHRQSVKADLAYFTQSVRNPNEDLAVAESGAKKGEPYLPVMPPYDAKILSDFKLKAIYQYLLTLNDEGAKGPAKLMAELPEESDKATALSDPYEILVTDRTRIYRTRIKGQSARAVYVGTPQGLNYAFDPITLSIERIWWGGFVNIAGSLDGRGKKPSRYGHLAQQVDLKQPLLAPLHPKTKKPIDLSFKTPRMNEDKSTREKIQGRVEFSELLAKAGGSFLGYQYAEDPAFLFEVGTNKFKLKFTSSVIGEAKLTLSGKLNQPQTFRLAPLIKGKEEDWTVTSLPAELTFTIPVKPAWRPTSAQAAPLKQTVRESSTDRVELPSGYQAKQISAPTDPHGREQLFEPLGMTAGRDGSLIVATRTSGVWILKDNSWTQVAEGLLDCLGVIQEEDGSLIVSQKPELTRLSDTDGDGTYDYYQTLSEAFLSTSNYHEYLHGPAKGADGNYYIALNLADGYRNDSVYKAGGNFMGSIGGYRGWALQVTPNGKTTYFANGLRSPAGLSSGPDGQIYYTENQGEYVGTSKLFKLERGKFYGHPSSLIDMPRMKPDSGQIQWKRVEDNKEKALALLPHSRVANAPGSPAWAPGAAINDLFIGDQTLSTLFEVHLQPNNEAAVVPFAKGFPSGLMRLVFDKNKDLYVGQTGRGWRSQGGSEHALIKIERTGKPLSNRVQNITHNGKSFTFSFSERLKEVPDENQLTIQSWTYLDSPKYGSEENDKTDHSIAKINKGSDGKSFTVELKSVSKSKDNRVFSFTSSQLPSTKGDAFEAFYSQVQK